MLLINNFTFILCKFNTEFLCTKGQSIWSTSTSIAWIFPWISFWPCQKKMFKKSLRIVIWLTSYFRHCQCTLSFHPWWEPQSLHQGSWQLLLHCCCFLSLMTQTRGTQSALESWCSAQCQCCRTSGCSPGQVSLCSDIFKRNCDWLLIQIQIRDNKIYLLHLSIQVSPACLGAPLSFVPHRFVARMCVNYFNYYSSYVSCLHVWGRAAARVTKNDKRRIFIVFRFVICYLKQRGSSTVWTHWLLPEWHWCYCCGLTLSKYLQCHHIINDTINVVM